MTGASKRMERRPVRAQQGLEKDVLVISLRETISLSKRKKRTGRRPLRAKWRVEFEASVISVREALSLSKRAQQGIEKDVSVRETLPLSGFSFFFDKKMF